MVQAQRSNFQQTSTSPIEAVNGDSQNFIQIDMSQLHATKQTLGGDGTSGNQISDSSVDGRDNEQQFLSVKPYTVIVQTPQQWAAKLRSSTSSAVELEGIDMNQSRKPEMQFEDDDGDYYNINAGKLRKQSVAASIAAVGPYDDDVEDEEEKEVNNQQNNMKINFNTRSSLNSSSSSLHMEDYFTQDQDKRKEEQMKRVIADITKFKSYFVKFRFEYFVEFFFYHALYCVFLGPIANPILQYFGAGIPRNLMFWGSGKIPFLQLLNYLLQACVIGIYATMQMRYVYFQSEIIYLFVILVFRIATIASKYATFDPYKIQALKENIFLPSELSQDYFLNDWRDQSDRIIYEEIYFAQRAYEIDPSWFYLEFIVSPEAETSAKLHANNKALSAYHKSETVKFEPQSIHTSSPGNAPFYIYGIVKELVGLFQQKNMCWFTLTKKMAFIYSILRVSAPTIYKYFEIGFVEYYANARWYEFFVSIAIGFLSFTLYYFTGWMLLHGIIDMRRKIFLMEQMAFMISPRKLRNIDSDKALPTINIFKSSNLKAWQLMRHVCQEYGKRYDIRVSAYFTGLVLAIIIQIIVLSLQLTSVIHLEQSFIAILLVETMCMLTIFTLILYYGASINEMFEVHDGILNQNKGVLMDIYRMRRRYFCQQFKTTNYLYNKGVQKIKEEVKSLQLESPCAHIKEIVDSYDTHIDELRFDQQQNPFKIGSITISNGLLESGIVGVSSIVIAIIAKYLSTRLEPS